MTGRVGGPGGISSAHAPALDLPARFMALAMLSLALVAVLSPWALPLLLEGFYAPRLLAFVHLNTLGVVAALIVGASYQLVPVVLQTELASVRLARATFWLYLIGLSLFLPGLLATWRPGLALGAVLLFSGLTLYAVVIGWTFHRAPRRDVVAWYILAALVSLAGGVLLGLLLGLNKGNGFLGAMTLRLLAGHVALMLGGWVALLISGVALRLVGMFTLSEDRLWPGVAWLGLLCSTAGAWLLAAGLLLDGLWPIRLAGALALAAGQLLFGTQLVHLYRVRRRRGFDVHIPFALVASLAGICSSLLLVAGTLARSAPESRIWVAVVWLALAGLAESAIQGFFYKIATFLVWLNRYAPLAGRQRVPRLEQLYGRRTAVAGWILWSLALALSLVAVFSGSLWLCRLAGLLALTGLAGFLANVIRIGSHWRPAERRFDRALPRAWFLNWRRIRKEGNIS